MLKNYLAAALRNLARNRLYSAISIFGLAVGFCAAILAALFIRSELSYERFIPGYERTYLAVSALMSAGRETYYTSESNNRVASLLKLKFDEIDAITRLAEQNVHLQRGNVTAKEKIYWADPNFFEVLPLPVFVGELTGALRRPDGIVLTRSMARKYFGHDNPVGETIRLDRVHVMAVAAIIEDLPVNGTQLEASIFASGLASHSKLTAIDGDPNNAVDSTSFFVTVRTYLRLKPNHSIRRLQEAMPVLMDSVWLHRKPGISGSMELVRLDRVHLFSGLNPGIGGRLAMTAAVGALILFVACVNFVNLSIALAARRSLEVGVRKAFGANRPALILRFIGESLVYVLLAIFIAAVLVELLLPHLNAFLNSGAVFDYRRKPALIAWIGIGALVLGVVSGMYPAFVLSAFAPVSVLKGWVIHARQAVAVRQTLVTLQFAILIVLLIAAGIVYQQRIYATRDALRVNTEQLLIIRSTGDAYKEVFNPCNTTFKTELQALPAVHSTACAGDTFLTGSSFGGYRLKDGRTLAMRVVPVDAQLLAQYGLRPVAGQLFQRQDTSASMQAAPTTAGMHLVINEMAARGLGYATPAAAIGKVFTDPRGPYSGGEIIGVVRDFTLGSVEQKIPPTVYAIDPKQLHMLSVKLTGQQIPETLTAIDKLWTASGATEPIDRFFLDDYIQNLYLSMLRQAQAFGVFSCIAVLLACLGLIGLAASTTERRTKEIGIRKAMGARTSEVMRLLVWQFTKPVLWANLIAWPVAAFVMNRWLQGFAYHIDLKLWLFVGATLIALVIALLTVSTHCYLVAREKPVRALRYE